MRLVNSIRVFIIGFTPLLYVSVTSAQTQDIIRSSVSDHDLIHATPADPTISSTNRLDVTFFIRVISATGQPISIAIPANARGWTAFSSAGANCTSVRFRISNIPTVSGGRLQNSVDPKDFTAGVKRAAIVPVTIHCQGLNRGDQLSITATFLALDSDEWVSQQFTWEERTIK